MTQFISVWSRKGGVGKSTLALNLAAAATQSGKKVLLVDSDKQASCLFLYQHKQFPFEVSNKLRDKNNYDLIIQDCAPNLDNVPMGSVVLVPYGTSGIDLGSVTKLLPVLEQKGKFIIEVVAKVNWQRKRLREFAIQKRSKGAFIIKDRGIYIDATNAATTIFDRKFNRAYKISEARNEINQLLNAALEHQHEH